MTRESFTLELVAVKIYKTKPTLLLSQVFGRR